MGLFNMPQIDMSSLNNENYQKKIANYLMMMNEQLRYMFGNIDTDNMTNVYNNTITGMQEGIQSLVKGLDGSYSLISQTADEIRMEVSSGLEGSRSLITQTASEIRSEVSSSITTLDGKIQNNTSKITQTATEIRSEVSSTFSNYSTTVQMNSVISQTASSITSQVSQTYATKTNLSVVEQTANKISWLVKSGTSSSNFTLTDRALQLVAAEISIQGYVTLTNLKTSGQTIINGGNITTGTLDCSKITVSNLSADSITTGTLSAARIGTGTLDCSKITVSNLSASVITTGTLNAGRIGAGTLDCSKITVSNLSADSITTGTLNAARIGTGTLDCSKITVSNLSADSITSGALSINYIKMNSYLVMNMGSSSNYLRIGGTNYQYVNGVEIGASSFNVMSDYAKLCPSGAMLGFFGSSGSQKKTVSNPSSSADATEVRSKLIELLNAFRSYGII